MPVFAKSLAVACSAGVILLSLPALADDYEKIIRGEKDGVPFAMRVIGGKTNVICRGDQREEFHCTPSERQALLWDAGKAAQSPAKAVAPVVEAATCSVIPLALTNVKIKSPYQGQCYKGMAGGKGKYTITYGDASQFTGEVSGSFRDGKLQGHAYVTTTSRDGVIKSEGNYRDNMLHGWYRHESSDGRVSKLEYQDGKPWSGVAYMTVNGVLSATRYHRGEEVYRCRADRQDELNCNPGVRKSHPGV